MAGIQNNGFNPNFVVNVNKGAKSHRPEAARAEEHAPKQPDRHRLQERSSYGDRFRLLRLGRFFEKTRPK